MFGVSWRLRDSAETREEALQGADPAHYPLTRFALPYTAGRFLR
jgi:hypothetical protein